jgi:hypothetical protein
MNERRAVVKAFAVDYRRACKKRKGEILDRFVSGTGYNRAYAGSLLRNHGRRVRINSKIVVVGDAAKKVKRRIRNRHYGEEVKSALRRFWAMLDFISSKRLAPALPGLLSSLDRHGELKLNEETRKKLLTISPSTIDRLLAEDRKRSSLKRASKTKPGTLLKHQIPIRTYSDWDEAKPGFVEVDLVGHDGGDGSGDFCQTLDMIDIATTWTEQFGVKNKAQVWTFRAIEDATRRFPFPLLGIDSDNGSEFINSHLKRFCDQNRITFTRSRPYRKNDTCYVEQKNWSIVRRFVGYRRYDTEDELAILNELYKRLRLFTNFFIPTLKMKEKIRDGSRVTRRYDMAKTPYQRVLESPHVHADVKNQLMEFALHLNPAELQRQIVNLQRRLQTISEPSRKHRKRERNIVEGAAPDGKAFSFTTGAWITPPEMPPSELPTPTTTLTTATKL